jgi:transcriptional regulatory protein LevR
VDVIAGEALAHGRLLAQSLTTVSKELLEGTVMESIKLW